MITNRRLIETIRGRAAAGDLHPHLPLASQPLVHRALLRAAVAVGAAGLSAALVVGVGDEVMSAAATAAVSGGGAGSGSGSGSDGDATVEELAASDAVEVLAEGAGAAVAAGFAAVESLPAEAGVDPVAVEELVPPPVVLTTPAPTTTPSTTPPTTTPTTTAPKPAVVTVTPPPEPGSVEAIITEVFGVHSRSAIGVARCESGLDPGAISRGGGNWGLFQINKVHRGRVEAMGYRWEDVLDARVNSLVAYAIFSEQGWGPWGCRHAA